MKIPIKSLKAAFLTTLPVLAGYVFLGFAFGLLVRSQGYPLWYAPFMSMTIYSGALEFAAVPLLSQPFDPISSFILGLLLSVRHLFYGLPMLKKFEKSGFRRVLLIFGLTDETFSLLSTVPVPADSSPESFYTSVTIFDWLYWVTGTLLGAVLGQFLGSGLEGLDFALTALFLVLFLEQVTTRRGLISGLMGLISTAMVLFLFGSEYMVIIAMGVILLLLLSLRRILTRE